MKKIKLLVVIASLFLVNNASANTIDINMDTNVAKITTKVLNEKMKELNNELFVKLELKNQEMMKTLQEKMNDEMSFKLNKSNINNRYVIEDMQKIRADKIKEKYKGKKYLCNTQTSITSI
jgi:hypothetical protein